ncbi:MAG: DUF1501 domain-containing protein [Planctomycetes bacterium]|nr:DUF1501 domain-containing protein [Planctomycetota bacterium]
MFRPALQVGVNRHGVTSRRAFLKRLGGAATAAGVVSLSWRDLMIVRADELRKAGRAMILLWMDGGPSQHETFNPKIGSKYQGPDKAIKTVLPGVEIAEHWPQTAKVMDKIALIRSMKTGESDHMRAIRLLKSGYKTTPNIQYPIFGSLVTQQTAADSMSDLPDFVRVGKPRIATRDINSGMLGARYESFKVNEPGRIPDNVVPLVTNDALKRRLALADRFDAEFAKNGGKLSVKEKKDVYDRTARFVTSPRLSVFDLSKETDRLRDSYGRSPFGQGCLLARRLVESGVTFVEVFSSGTLNDQGWDTHKRGFKENPLLAQETDPGYATLLKDLAERGMLDRTLVVWMGEFGRTPKFKKEGGRDHYAEGWPVGLSGAGIKTGQVIGATDSDGVKVTDRPIGVQDLFVSFCHALGMDPRAEYVTAQDQPHQVVKGGELVKELFG